MNGSVLLKNAIKLKSFKLNGFKVLTNKGCISQVHTHLMENRNILQLKDRGLVLGLFPDKP